jgi:hypothetical protein
MILHLDNGLLPRRSLGSMFSTWASTTASNVSCQYQRKTENEINKQLMMIKIMKYT